MAYTQAQKKADIARNQAVADRGDLFYIEGSGLYNISGQSINTVDARSEAEYQKMGINIPTLTPEESDARFRSLVGTFRQYGAKQGFVNEFRNQRVTGETAEAVLRGDNVATPDLNGNIQGGQTTPQTTQQQTYQVPQGSNLTYSARAMGITLQQLLEANPEYKANPNFVRAGAILRYPQVSTQEQTPATSDSGASGEVLTTDTQVSDQLQEPYKTMFDIMRQQLNELQNKGQVINAEIEITPDRVAEFMRTSEGTLDIFLPYASKEILPYYQSQLKLAREDFLRGLGYSRDKLLRTEQDVERKFQKSLKETGERFAEKGFALSGARVGEEQELADVTQRGVEEGRRQFGFEAGTEARKFAQRFGSANVPEFEIQGQGKPLYELSPEVYQGLTGEEEFKQRSTVRSRAAELESAFRQNQQIQNQRKLLL